MVNSSYKILVPTDFGEQSDFALHQALHLSQIVNGEIVLLYVLHEKKGVLGKIFNKEQKKSFNTLIEEQLKEQSKAISEKHKVVVSTALLHSTSISGEITKYADEIQAAIIVMGKGAIYIHGKEVDGIGSNTSKVLRNSKIPVITVSNSQHSKGCDNILLPLDLTKETRQKVSWGIQFAKLFDSKIHVISGLWDTDNEFVVNKINTQMKQVTKFIKQQGVKVESEIIIPKQGIEGIVPVISTYVKKHPEIDLTIIMTQQEDDFTEFFIGSEATSFIRGAKCPVMSIVPRKLDDVILGM
jgi:nucleotide-binding universal stress UspA family protein